MVDWEYLLLTLFVIWLAILLAAVVSMIRLLRGNYRPLDESCEILQRAEALFDPGWLAETGFFPACAVRPTGDDIALFRHTDEVTLLGVYFTNSGTYVDYITIFSNQVGLTTGNTASAHTSPPAIGSITQTFPSLSHTERWNIHAETVQKLVGELGLPKYRIGDVDREFELAVKSDIRYVFNKPWLVLAIPWRFFVTRHRYRDLSVLDQIDRGWINIFELKHQVHDLDSK